MEERNDEVESDGSGRESIELSEDQPRDTELNSIESDRQKDNESAPAPHTRLTGGIPLESQHEAPTKFDASDPQYFPSHKASTTAQGEPKSPVVDQPTEPNMSRGGRGGARGGAFKGTSWEHDPSIKLDSSPDDLFPDREIPFSEQPTAEEKSEVANFLSFRAQVHNGPLYTKPRKRDAGERKKMYSEDQENDSYAAKGAADFDPFTGVPTWDMKYEPKQRELPLLSGHHFNKELFPKELWDTISGESGKEVQNSINKAIKRKNDLLSGRTSDERMAAIIKLTEGIDDNELDEDAVRDPEDGDEEELDDDYEGAEGEMGGDYDAEQYFDNGEDDEDDADGGGGGDDY